MDGAKTGPPEKQTVKANPKTQEGDQEADDEK
jgi:hypothetical protein